MTDNLQVYLTLYRDLVSTIEEHGNESHKADAIRDALDSPWRKMTYEESLEANRTIASEYMERGTK